MRIKLKFNAASSSSKMEKALPLAKMLNGLVDPTNKKIMIVEAEHNEHDLVKLINSVSSLAKTEVFLDENVKVSAGQLGGILTCPKKRYCKGLCDLEYHQDFLEILKALGIIKDDRYNDTGLDSWQLSPLNEDYPQIVTAEDETTITLDRELLRQSYVDSMWLISKVCLRYKEDDLLSRLDALPSQIVIKKACDDL